MSGVFQAVQRRARWQLLRMRRARGERGSMSIFYAVAAPCIFLIIGLVADGGGALNAAARADDVAQEAARAGGQEIDAGKAIPGEAVVVDPAAAARAARAYLTRENVRGRVAVSGDGTTITVSVSDSYPTNFSSLVGYTTIAVTGMGTAHLVHQGD
jgi:Flp pilus assembly protein TadG